MRSIFIVLYYTIRQTIKKRYFWITNIIMAVILFAVFAIVSSMNIPNLSMDSFSIESASLLEMTHESVYSSTITEVTEESKDRLPKVIIIDNTTVFGKHLNLLLETGHNFVIDKDADLETIKQDINDHAVHAVVIINETDGTVSFDYIVLENSDYNKEDARLVSQLLGEIKTTKLLTEARHFFKKYRNNKRNYWL